ncbi:MAG: hypothetical protein M3N29_06825 [Chloroflexota bacterium]|nr:hypothetical protein [Chloroflexota bacterium]
MSKRSRGPARSTHRRPGTRPPTTRAGRPAHEAAASTSPLEAAPVVAEDVIEDRPAEARRELEQVASSAPRQRVKAGSILAARAATEYVYVAQDLRRILVVSVVLVGFLIVLWLLIVILRVIPLEFY